jgi:hypothetical protein
MEAKIEYKFIHSIFYFGQQAAYLRRILLCYCLHDTLHTSYSFYVQSLLYCMCKQVQTWLSTVIFLIIITWYFTHTDCYHVWDCWWDHQPSSSAARTFCSILGAVFTSYLLPLKVREWVHFPHPFWKCVFAPVCTNAPYQLIAEICLIFNNQRASVMS